MLQSDAKMHPTIKKCLKHLEVLGAEDKTKQIVYMYMETLVQELSKEEASEQQLTVGTSPNNR